MPMLVVNLAFSEKNEYLRVRSSRSLKTPENVVYKVKKSDFADVCWSVDHDDSTKEWLKINEVRRKNGSVVGGEGWVVKHHGSALTLIPVPNEQARPNLIARPSMVHRFTERVRDLVQERAAQGAGGLNVQWMVNQFRNFKFRRAVFDDGAAAWEYTFDGVDPDLDFHIRVVKRYGIVAEQGHGEGIANALHAAAAQTIVNGRHADHQPMRPAKRQRTADADLQSMNPSKRQRTAAADHQPMRPATRQRTADVILVFLCAIQGAVQAHSEHGYKLLEGVEDKGLQVMYHQEGSRELTESQVRQMKEKYYSRRISEPAVDVD